MYYHTESGWVYVLSNQLSLRGCILYYTYLVTFQVSESAAGGRLNLSERLPLSRIDNVSSL